VLLKAGLLGIGFLSLVGCSMPFASNDKEQYLESKHAPDLVISRPLTSSNLSGFYILPPAPEHPKVDILPPVG